VQLLPLLTIHHSLVIPATAMDASLPQLIQEMLQPEFYPHPVPNPIQLIQTHISYVLLAGDYAYKVKKPANFGFLDFSSLDKRQYFCQEELRLNRRLSPGLYLEVLSIVQTPEGHYRLSSAADAPESVAEVTLKMQQFDQENQFSRLFAKNQLTLAQMQTLGQDVAAFHAVAHTDAEVQAYGSLAATQQVDENNYGLSEQFIGRSQTQTQFEQTRNFTRNFFSQHADWFKQRQAEGKIRECHGDLHLGNICLYQDKIQVFDCIEFNKEFRNIDTIYDAAFLVMDLQFLGRPDLANTFLNAYLEWTGDYWGGVLLPLYLSMRAYIRGNVNSLALNDPAISSDEKVAIQERAAAYYRLAWDYTQPQAGRIFVMSGLSGVGKSTVGRELAQLSNAIHIRSDAVRKHLAGVPLQQRGDEAGAIGSGIYTPEMTQKTYDRLQELALLLAGQGFTVILDAKYDRQAFRETVLRQAQTAQIPVNLLYCSAPEAVIRERLQQRQGDIADATEAMLTEQLKSFETFTASEQSQLVTIHTESDLTPQLKAVL
jgi:aminoglycoside phosphotransferase family enzyme/predicted kinase